MAPTHKPTNLQGTKQANVLGPVLGLPTTIFKPHPHPKIWAVGGGAKGRKEWPRSMTKAGRFTLIGMREREWVWVTEI